MRRVLIVSYDFPPSSIGIWRTLKFCKYMGGFGWQPSILTVKPVRGPAWDMAPLRELPPGTEVRRTGSLDTNRLAQIALDGRARLRGARPAAGTAAHKPNPRPTNALFRRVMDALRAWVLVPDDRAPWYPFAVRAGARWLREQRFDVVYTTSYPHTAHLVGERLSRLSGLPLVADYRDIWIGNYTYYHPATAWHDRLHRRLERRVIEGAAGVIACTRPITDDFLERYPDQPPAKFSTIPNGFDPPDFPPVAPRLDPGHFTIGYVGTMYGSTSPATFLRGVQALLEREPAWRDVLRLRFVGSMIEPYRALIDSHGLAGITRCDNYLPHDEALCIMAGVDALLLLVAPVKGAHIMLTQKVFEYAAARRPIIGLVPEGAARDFLRDIDEGPILDPADVEGVAASLGAMLREWRERGRRELPANPRLAQYERRSLTERLCAVLDRAVEERA